MFDLKHNAANTIFIDLESDADGITPVTGATPTATILKAGGAAYGAIAGSVTEVASGTYAVALAAADASAIGTGKLLVTATGAISRKYDLRVLPINVYDSLYAGMDALEVDVASVLGTDPLDYEVGGVRDPVALTSAYDAAKTAAPTAAENATAVWAAGTRTLTGFGTLAADVATAVWAATSRTLTSLAGLIGYQPRVVSPVMSDYSIEIVSGDDYTGDSAIAMPRATWAGEDLTGATAEFRYMDAGAHAAGTGTWAAIGTVSITPGAGVVDASVELTGAESGGLNTSPPARKYHYVYQLVVTQDGREHTLWEGKLTVKL